MTSLHVRMPDNIYFVGGVGTIAILSIVIRTRKLNGQPTKLLEVLRVAMFLVTNYIVGPVTWLTIGMMVLALVLIMVSND